MRFIITVIVLGLFVALALIYNPRLRRYPKMKKLGLLATFILLGGCSSAVFANVLDMHRSGSQHNAIVVADLSPTYYRDVEPILRTSCIGCHFQGGIAPFSLSNPAEAVAKAQWIASATRSGAMPPWMPGSDSPPYTDDPRLTPEQKAILSAWAEIGAPLGEPRPISGTSQQPDVKPPDQSISMAHAYMPNSSLSDDYRCFILDPQLVQDQLLTSYHIQPGQMSLVHHVILYRLLEEEVREAEALDAQETGEGYTCFGGPGIQANSGQGNGSRWLGVWAPGSASRISFPSGTAMLLPKGSKIVMQVHYNLSSGAKPDQTRVDLTYAPSDAELLPLQTLLLSAPVEIPCPARSTSTLCDRETVLSNGSTDDRDASQRQERFLDRCGKSLEDYTQEAMENASNVKTSCDYTRRTDATLYGVAGHMHLLGKAIEVELNPDSDQSKVILDIPHWDFHWQDLYWLQTPMELKQGDVLRVTCHYDNSVAHQPTIDGQVQQPRYVVWGEGTLDEMCIAPLVIAPSS